MSTVLGPARWLPPLALSFFVFAFASVEHRLPRQPLAADVVFLAWIVLAILSSVYSVTPAVTFGRGVSLLLGYLAVYWAIWRFTDQASEARVLDLILVATAFVYGAGIVLLVAVPGGVFLAGRFRGLLQNPNAVGLLTAILFPLVLYRMLIKRGWREYALCASMLFSLVMTASRSSLLAVCLTSALMLAKARSRWLLLPIGSVVVIGLAFAGMVPLPFDLAKYARLNHLATGSGRLELWPILIEYIRHRPFFGYGFGTEDYLLEAINRSTIFTEFSGGYAHNSYLGLTVQLGLVGSVTFFLPLFLLLLHGLLDMGRERGLQRHHAFTMTILAGLVLAIAESWIYSLGNAMAFPFWIVVMLQLRHWAVAGSAVAEEAPDPKESPASSANTGRWPALLPHSWRREVL
jgi:O-antigen ligase